MIYEIQNKVHWTRTQITQLSYFLQNFQHQKFVQNNSEEFLFSDSHNIRQFLSKTDTFLSLRKLWRQGGKIVKMDKTQDPINKVTRRVTSNIYDDTIWLFLQKSD